MTLDLPAAAPGQGAGAQPAKAQQPASPAPADTQADLLFVQQAAGAELVFDSAETDTERARLILHNVSPTTTW